jgi:NAD(P)H dehydrogenase (quinone)
MLASGLSPWQTEGSAELFDWIRNGGADSVTPWVPELTGYQARPVEDWLSELRGAFLWQPPDLPSSPF